MAVFQRLLKKGRKLKRRLSYVFIGLREVFAYSLSSFSFRRRKALRGESKPFLG
jgi:hypothetical protein